MIPFTSVISLIVANLVPLFGVMYLGWDLFFLLILYWTESAIIGFYNIFKMYFASNKLVVGRYEGLSGVRTFNYPKIFSIIFFIIHYGLFMIVHLTFIFTVFSPFRLFMFFSPKYIPLQTNFKGIGLEELVIGFLSLFVSHTVSFFINFIGKKEYLKYSSQQFMSTPYKRIFAMHFTIMFGGFAVNVLGSPIYALVVLVIAKTVIDIQLHLKEHGVLSRNI